MSKQPILDLGALDRLTIAREFDDGPIAGDGYLEAKAADPAWFRTNYGCYIANAAPTIFEYHNKKCCPLWMALAVCGQNMPDAFDITLEVHGSNDDFASADIVATKRWTADSGHFEYVIFNTDFACQNHKKLRVHVAGAAGLSIMAHLTPVKVTGC